MSKSTRVSPPARSSAPTVIPGQRVRAEEGTADLRGALARAERLGPRLDRIPIDAPGARVPDDQVRRSADDGLRTPASALPHAERLQPAFGRHSLEQLQAHLGPTASASAAAMDARAFTAGRHLVFSGAPDPFTVAHEAVHAFRQLGGTSPVGGIGQTGDRHEQEADTLARRAVSGQSVESMVDGFMAGPAAMQGSAAPSSASIQRLTDRERAQLRLLIAEDLARNNLPHDGDSVQRVMNVVAPVQALVRISAFNEPERLGPSVVANELTLQTAWWRAQGLIADMARRAAPRVEVHAQDQEMEEAPVAQAQPAPAQAQQAPAQQQQAPAQQQQAMQVEAQQAPVAAPQPQAPAQQPAPLSEAQRQAARLARFGNGALLQQQANQQRAQEEAAVAGNLGRAQINFVGGRWDAHLTDRGGDGTAGLTEAQARNAIRTAGSVDSRGLDRFGHPSYSISYERGLSIVFSTQNGGRTVSVFHIGPGG